MMGSANDITDLFSQQFTAEIGFRQGVIVTFNTSTGENTINIGGTIHTDIAVLNLASLSSLAAGDVVGLLRVDTTYFILGEIIEP